MSGTFIRLTQMKEEWEALKIDSHFPKVHHFSNEKFKSKPPTLSEHYEYCKDKEIEFENIQTLNRALTASKLFSHGLSIDDAIKKSWIKYPVLRE